MRDCTVAEAIVEYLRLEEIDHLFAVPGSAIEELMDAFYGVHDVRFVTTQHEQGAGYMAHGYARITGRPGVCAVTRGPGGTNLLTSIAMAYYESAPVVAILGDVPTRTFGRGRSVYQEIGYVDLFKGFTKKSIRLERAERIGEALQMAFRTALSGRRGPVALAIPSDLMAQRVTTDLKPFCQYRPVKPPCANRDLIEQAADMLAGAVRPAVLLGGGARDAGAGPAALDVAGLIGALVGSTASVKGVIDENDPRSLECLGRHGNPLGRFLYEADVLLAVGTTLAETTTRFDDSLIGPQTSIIQVDIDPEEIGRVYNVQVGLVGDARLVLEDIAAALRQRGLKPKSPDRDSRVLALAEAKRHWHGQLQVMESSTDNDGSLGRLRFQKELRQALPKETILVAEGGGTLSYYQYSFPTYKNGYTVGDLSPLGSAYPFALGLKCGAPVRDVVSIHGDGAYMFSMNELATALHWRINTIAVVLHNSVYGNERESQHKRHHGRYVGTDLYIPDLARVAEAFGAHGERVERPDEIAPALDRVRRSGKPGVLDVIVSSSLKELLPPR